MTAVHAIHVKYTCSRYLLWLIDCNIIVLLDECPDVVQLEQLRTQDGRVIKIVTEVAGDWEQMAQRLDFSEPEVIIIRRSHPNDVESACTDMFERWLAGEHRQPVTWQTVVDCLKELDLNVVASDLDNILYY